MSGRGYHSGTGGGGSGAPAGAQYVTLATDAGLSAERVLTAGTGITIVDGGANGPVTVSASGGGASAAPGGIEGLAAWYVADDLALHLADTANVVFWPNRIPNAAIETLIATGTQPIFRTSIVNGKAVVRFAGGATERLGSTSSRMLQMNTWRQMTLIAVASHGNAAQQTKNFLAAKGSVGAYEFTFGVPNNVANAFNLQQAAGTSHASPGTYGSASVQNTFYINTARASRAQRVDQWRDGGVRITSTTFTGAMGAAGADFNLGGDVDGGASNSFEGDIAEFLWYSRALSFAELDTINTYLAARYAITTTAHS